jgi:NADH-quinone oxidoreductase subunit L
LMFGGAVSKSAQFPLYVWLPDAMAGPTPVSALIHAATMVVAGIYMVARMFLVFEHAGAALDVVAVVAAITMLLAAILALVQDDIKKVLAYSTISQLAYMMAALGVGAYTAAIFHLFTHAFFKALLFLGAGSLIHAVHSNNMSDMGGLRKYMPHTFKTFLIGSLALAGIFPLAGFFSKDEIIGGALRSASENQQAVAWIVLISGVITAFLTALYMTRAVVKTFWGEYRGHGTPHESGGAMVTPLWVLAIAAVFVGFLGFPVIGPFAEWITVPGHEHHGFEFLYNIILPIGATIVAVAAIALGAALFLQRRWNIDILGSPFAWLYRFVENRYYLDDFYLNGIVRPVQYPISRAAYWSNQKILDGIVNGTAAATLAVSRPTYAVIDQQVVDFAVNGAAGITGASGGLLRYIQSGNVQRYAAVLFAAVALFVALFALT